MARIYLDACCLNRPYDDQTQTRVRLESEAVQEILEKCTSGIWTMLCSEALEFELLQTPDLERRRRTLRSLEAASERMELDTDTEDRPELLRSTYGLRQLDSLHLAFAESLKAGVSLTTDDRLLRACGRMPAGELLFSVANPLAWLTSFPNDV